MNLNDVLIKLGLDASGLSEDTAKVLAGQKTAAEEYVATWNAALKAKEAAEIKANTESLARLKAYQSAQLSMTETFLAEQSAMYAEQQAVLDIGKGSIPAGWVGAVGAVAKDAKTAEKIEHKVGSFRHAGHALRETGKLVGDITGVSSAVTILRSVGSALRAIALIGGGAVTVLVAGAAGIASALWIRNQLNTNFGIDTKDPIKTQKKQHDALSKFIDDKVRSGQLDKKTAADLHYRLRGGDTESVLYVQARLKQLGISGDEKFKAQKDTKEALEHEKNLAELKRKGETIDQRLASDKKDQSHLQDLILDAQQRGLSTIQLQLQLDKANANVQQDILDKKKAQAEIDKKTSEYQQRYNDLQLTLKKEIAERDKFSAAREDSPFIPTVEELNGPVVMRRVEQYKNWLARNSPLRGLAYDYTQAQLFLARDVAFQNGSDAIAADQGRIRQLRGSLSDAGILPPDERLAEISDRINNTNDEIGALVKMAAGEGITIKAG